MACAVVCEHCQAPVPRQQCVIMEGYSYHQTCRKCYVCSETDLKGAEVFRGVIFCSSCSQRIFQGCSTARKVKETSPRIRRKSNRRRSQRDKDRLRTRQPDGILAMTGLLTSSDTSKSSSDVTKLENSRSVILSTEVALTVPKPTFNEDKSMKKSSVEVGMMTEVTQKLLKQLNCPVVTRYQNKKIPTAVPATSPLQKKSPCSDLRIAELGTSREIANMALRHKNELPVIIGADGSEKHLTSTSESVINRETDSAEHADDWLDSAYSTLDGSTKSQWLERPFGSILRMPYFAFKRKILRRSSLISNILAARDSVCVFKKFKRVFHHEYTSHQKRGLKRLYSIINRKKTPHKLGWLNSLTSEYYNNENSKNSTIRCRHFHASHSYRCMRAQAMQLAGPTRSELAVIRRKLTKVFAPPFVRSLAITYSKRPAIMTSQACGTSKPASCNGSSNNESKVSSEKNSKKLIK